MDIIIVAQQMLMLSAMMAVGFIITKLEWINDDTSLRLSKLTSCIFNPLLVVNSVIGQDISKTGSLFWENLGLVFVFYLILFIAGWIINPIIRTPKTDAEKFRMLTLFPNCGFMGIPVIASLLGNEYVIYVAIYMLFYNVILYTYGISMVKASVSKMHTTSSATFDACTITASNINTHNNGLSSTKRKSVLRTLLLNPGLISSVFALILFFCGITLPKTVNSFIGYMSAPCIPISMMLIGHSIAKADLVRIIKNLRLYLYIILRQIALPIACCFLVRLLPFDTENKMLFIILLSMPAGSMTAIITKEYGGDSEFISSGIVLTTITSLVTLPFVSLFL